MLKIFTTKKPEWKFRASHFGKRPRRHFFSFGWLVVEWRERLETK